jgi:hypothetical protein
MADYGLPLWLGTKLQVCLHFEIQMFTKTTAAGILVDVQCCQQASINNLTKKSFRRFGSITN